MKHDMHHFVSDVLNSMPHAGAGVHNWLFRAARRLHGSLSPGEIEELLRNSVSRCGRRVPGREIAAAVRNAGRCASRASQPSSPSSPHLTRSGVSSLQSHAWRLARDSSLNAGDCETGDSGLKEVSAPKLSVPLRESVLRSPLACGLADLWERSPVRLDSAASRAEEIIDAFFPGNPLLCCGRVPARFDTRPRAAWRGQLSTLALIVPSPMSAVTGLTQEGRASRHTLDNTGPRRFLVCEFDRGHADEHAALLWHLAQMAPLVCAVHSGGKSLHGWFCVQDFSEEQTRRFFRHAVRLGADPATWTRSQFVRLPDGRRDNGRAQTVFYLNPQALNQKP